MVIPTIRRIRIMDAGLIAECQKENTNLLPTGEGQHVEKARGPRGWDRLNPHRSEFAKLQRKDESRVFFQILILNFSGRGANQKGHGLESTDLRTSL